MLEDASQSLLFQDDSVRLNHILPVPSPQFDPMSMLNADMFTGSAFAPIPAVELSQNESGISRLAPFACSNSNIGYSIVEASRCIRSVQLRLLLLIFSTGLIVREQSSESKSWKFLDKKALQKDLFSGKSATTDTQGRLFENFYKMGSFIALERLECLVCPFNRKNNHDRKTETFLCQGGAKDPFKYVAADFYDGPDKARKFTNQSQLP